MAKRATSKKREESDLVKALKFIQIAQDDDGKTPNEKHCRFINGYVVASNGILAAGAPAEGVQAENACPHTFRLTEALERAGGQISLTMQPNWTIAIKSDKFNAIVPCVQNEAVYWINPELWQYSLNDNFRDAGQRAGTFTTVGAESLINAAIISTQSGLLGTNSMCIIEAIHGSPFPPGLIIPKEFFAALNKVQSKIVGFGYTSSGLTIWFEDKTFLRTQLYQDAQIPPAATFEKILYHPELPSEYPKGFFESVKTVASFSEDDAIRINDDEIASHNDSSQGAQIVQKIEAMTEAVNAKFLLMIEPFCTWLDLEHQGGRSIYFQNENTRGVVSKRVR